MSDLKALFKHSSNYLLANLATKALAFISIPVYTRLLSVEEFGIVNVFLAIIGISSVVLTLNTEVAISRFYYDAKDLNAFKEFVGTSVLLSGGIFMLMVLVVLVLLPDITHLLSFDCLLTLAIIPVSFYYIVNSIFQQIYGPLMESKRIAIVSSIQVYLAFFFSVIFILSLPTEKYYGQVLGTMLAMIILSMYLIKQIKPYFCWSFKKKYIHYILSYSLPYLPYSLSGVILAQFGRMIMGQYFGFESAGLYSFAASIGGLMLILISVTHQAWNPYYFQYMNEKDYISIDNDYKLIWSLTLSAALCLSIFGSEIGMILGKEDYFVSLYLIPYFVLGYVFYQWAYVYLRNAGYAKQTIWNTLAVFLSGFLNIFLSIFLVDRYKELGVAMSFCISYFALFLISYVINVFCIKLYVPKLILFYKPLLYFIPFFIVSIMSYNNCCSVMPYFLYLFIKSIICILGCCIFMREYIGALIDQLKKHF